MYVCDGPTKMMGGIFTIGGICLQQELLQFHQDDTFQIPIWEALHDTSKLGHARGSEINKT